jgi:hypothetical protein
MARPHECRGIPFSPDDEARGRLAYRAHASVKPVPSFRACRARPSAGWTLRGETALREKGPKIGEGRFSRRGAVSAPARYGRTNGKALRCHRWFCDKLVAEARQHLGLALCLLHGRAEPAPPRGRGLADGRGSGSRPQDFAKGPFPGGDALCASAWYGLPDARAFHPHPMRRRTALWPTGRMPRSSRCLPIRACGARPTLGQARQRSPSWKGPGEDGRGGSLGPGSGVLHLCRLHAISFLKVASAHLAFSEIDTILTIPVRFA